MTQEVNDQLVLITGESATGKSASLMNLPPKTMYLNCESGKRLPFRNKFETFVITDPYQIFEAFNHAQGNSDYDVIVIDTLTFLMDMFESQYVLGSADTMKGWSNYQQFFKKLMQQYIAKSDKSVIILAHTKRELDDGEWASCVPVKGALQNNGIEAYFSTVVSTKKVDLKELADQDPALLDITPQDEALGYKHVFQTQVTKKTRKERIRAPMGMFAGNQVYMDNNAMKLLTHLNEYYGIEAAA